MAKSHERSVMESYGFLIFIFLLIFFFWLKFHFHSSEKNVEGKKSFT